MLDDNVSYTLESKDVVCCGLSFIFGFWTATLLAEESFIKYIKLEEGGSIKCENIL